MSRSVLTKISSLPNITARASARRPVPVSACIMASNRTLKSEAISEITAKEKELTGEKRPVAGGPTAQAQKHANEQVTANVISDITQGEKNVTGREGPVEGGPAAFAQSIASSVWPLPSSFLRHR